MRKKVCVICTGGTLVMQENGDGQLHVGANHANSLEAQPFIIDPRMPESNFIQLDPIDSSQMTIEYWNTIVDTINTHYDAYDGFVILHGTDTMAYTGSALSFMLENISKPIILTGAQRPLSKPINDARENIINAIYIAGNFPEIQEVCIYFNQLLLRANRTTKFSTTDYRAFRSFNYPTLAEVGSSIQLTHAALLKHTADQPLIVKKFDQIDIRFIRITPYVTAKALETMCIGAQTVVLETLGDGNMLITAEIENSIKKIIGQGIILINRSQCLNSMTCTSKYLSGETLESLGVVSAHDQTVETISAKLVLLFSKKLSLQDIRYCFVKDICGEITRTAVTPKKTVALYLSREESRSPIVISPNYSANYPGFFECGNPTEKINSVNRLAHSQLGK